MTDQIVIFAFFLAGTAAAFFGSELVPSVTHPRLFLSGLMITVLLLSASTVGCVLLPLCALLMGCFAEQSAGLGVASWFSDGQLQLRLMLSAAVLIPVFFMASVHGMTVSAALQMTLQRGSPTARTVFHRELSLVALFILLAFAVIFYFY